jgi:hypothetical protein
MKLGDGTTWCSDGYGQICADQPVTRIFRLQQGDGPYMEHLVRVPRAIAATLATGFSVSCTISSFSETVRQRRTPRSELTSNSSAMSQSSRSPTLTARRERACAYEAGITKQSANSGRLLSSRAHRNPLALLRFEFQESTVKGLCPAPVAIKIGFGGERVAQLAGRAGLGVDLDIFH